MRQQLSRPVLALSLFFGLTAGWSMASAQPGSFSQLPPTIRVQIEIDYGLGDCEGGGDLISYRETITGDMKRASTYSDEGIYSGELEIEISATTCFTRCPDGDCMDACHATERTSGKVKARVTAIHSPLAIDYYGDQPGVKVSTTNNDCPYDPYESEGFMGTYYVIDTKDAWPPFEDGKTYDLWMQHISAHFHETGGGPAGKMFVSTGAPVKAVAGGPYRVQRGESVRLDGSESRGLGLTYQWTLAPRDCPGGLGGKPGVELGGATPTVTLLCSMNATLEVSNAQGRDRATVPVTVVARQWETTFEHVAEEGHLDRPMMRPVIKRVGNEDGVPIFEGGFVGGENVSAYDASRTADKTLEPIARNGTWEGGGYVLMEVADAGPFAGYWYVADYKIEVKRKTLINPHLIPGGKEVMRSSFYEENKRLETQIDEYLTAIRAHEGLADARGTLGHSGLIQKALRERDPAKEIEKSFRASNREELRTYVDELLRDVDFQLCDASKDPLPLIWRGRVAFPQDDWTGYVVVHAVTAGGGDYGHMPECKRGG